MTMNRDFYKRQTQYSWLPPFIHARQWPGDNGLIGISVRPSYSGDEPIPKEATILMTPEEATGFAAWLGDRAEKMMRARRKAQERKVKRQEARKKA